MSTGCSGGPRWLNEREERAWRGYMQMRALLDLQISRDLARDSGLSDADYQVLVGLSEAPQHRARMIDLARLMLWSKSRLGHHLDRMQQRGLVRRDTDPSSTRAAVIVLTEEGLRTMQEAAPKHLESVRRHFIDLLTNTQIDAIADATKTVVAHLRTVEGER